MIDNTSDPILQRLSRLPVLASDQTRAERLRARCRARLDRQAPPSRQVFGPALIAGLCLLYLSALVHDVLRLRGGL